MMHFGNYYGHGGHPVFWAILGVIAVVIVGAAIVGLLFSLQQQRRGPEQTRPGSQSAAPAVQILNERFARGEIDEDEYTKRRTLLGG